MPTSPAMLSPPKLQRNEMESETLFVEKRLEGLIDDIVGAVAEVSAVPRKERTNESEVDKKSEQAPHVTCSSITC